MALGYNQSVTIEVGDADAIKEVAKRIEYYHNYGALLISSVAWNNPILNKVLAELTTNSQGSSEATIEQVTSIIMAGATLIAYILAEGFVDANRDS